MTVDWIKKYICKRVKPVQVPNSQVRNQNNVGKTFLPLKKVFIYDQLVLLIVDGLFSFLLIF